MMTAPNNTHTHALIQYISNAGDIRQSDVHMFTLHGQRYVVKFARPRDRSRPRAWASAVVCGALFGKFPSPSRLLPASVQHEAKRLRQLREQGIRVPIVHLVTDDHLILEHCGDSLETILKATPPGDERTQLLWAIVDDLIEFHRAGHWHGGAQIRNLTLKNGMIHRIDFEEQIGAALPLPFAQAFDVSLAFNSLIDHLHGDRRKQGIELLQHYLQHTPSPQTVRTLKRLEHWLDYFRRLEPHLGQRVRKKRDFQRTRKLAWILNGALASHQSDSKRHISLPS